MHENDDSLDDQLFSEIKQLAAQSGQTLTAVIEEALRQMLARRRQMAERRPVELITVSGQGPQPGQSFSPQNPKMWPNWPTSAIIFF